MNDTKTTTPPMSPVAAALTVTSTALTTADEFAHPVELDGNYAVGALAGLNMYRGEFLAVAKLVDIVSVLDVSMLRDAASRLALSSNDDDTWRVAQALQKVAALDPAGMGAVSSALETLVRLTDAANAACWPTAGEAVAS